MLRKIRRFLLRLLLIPLLIVAIIYGLGAFSEKTAHSNPPTYKQQIETGTNSYRASQGKPVLTHDPNLEKIAQAWADHLVKNSEYKHNPNLSQQVFADNSYRSVAENLVAQRDDGTIALQAWVGSDGHRKNLLGDYNRQGVGVAEGGDYGKTYVQVLAYKDAPVKTAPPPEAPSKPAPETKATEKPAAETSTTPAPQKQGEAVSGKDTGSNPQDTTTVKQETEETTPPKLTPLKYHPPVLLSRDSGTDNLLGTTTHLSSHIAPALSEQVGDEAELSVRLSDFLVPLTAGGLGVSIFLLTALLKRRDS